MDTFIGIDIGGTNLRIGYVDEAGTIFGFEKKFIGAVVKEDIVSDLEQKIAAYIRQHDLQKSCRAVAQDSAQIGATSFNLLVKAVQNGTKGVVGKIPAKTPVESVLITKDNVKSFLK